MLSSPLFRDTITNHFIEFGLWEKIPDDLAYELRYPNNGPRTELAQAHQKNGEPGSAYHPMPLFYSHGLMQGLGCSLQQQGMKVFVLSVG